MSISLFRMPILRIFPRHFTRYLFLTNSKIEWVLILLSFLKLVKCRVHFQIFNFLAELRTLTRNRSAWDSSESPPPTSTQSPSGDWSDMTAARVRTTNVEGGGDAEETPRSRWFWFWSSDVVRLEVDLDIQSRRSRAPS